MALLDIGTEINLMRRAFMKKTGPAMRCGPRLKLISYTDHFRSFHWLFKDIDVAVGGLKTRYPIFVIENAEHDLVLAQRFLNNVKLLRNTKST